mgnify:CR=1 FL=1
MLSEMEAYMLYRILAIGDVVGEPGLRHLEIVAVSVGKPPGYKLYGSAGPGQRLSGRTEILFFIY